MKQEEDGGGGLIIPSERMTATLQKGVRLESKGKGTK